MLLDNVDPYLKGTSTDSVENWEDFLSYIETAGSISKESLLDEAKAACRILDDIEKPSKDIIQKFIDREYLSKLKDVVVDHSGARSTAALDKAIKTVDDYYSASVVVKRKLAPEYEPTIEEDFRTMVKTGYSWPWAGLNTVCGPIDHELVIVASRPDGGKTAFLTHMVAHILKQLDEGKEILWFNNEQKISVVRQRVIKAILNKTSTDIEADPVKAQREWKAAGGERIVYIDNATTVSKVERALHKHDPGFIVFDQLYKIHGKFGFEGGGDVEADRLRQLCQWARDIGKHHTCPIFATNQLDATADGNPTPTLGSLYNSKTGMQGEADCIIMLGFDTDNPGLKFVTTPKNKLTGKKLLVKLEIHPEVSRYVEV